MLDILGFACAQLSDIQGVPPLASLILDTTRDAPGISAMDVCGDAVSAGKLPRCAVGVGTPAGSTVHKVQHESSGVTRDVVTPGRSVPAPVGVLSAPLDEWACLHEEVLAGVRDLVAADFAAACHGYIAQRRDFRLLSGTSRDGAHLDLSSALCEPISRLNAELSGIRNVIFFSFHPGCN